MSNWLTLEEKQYLANNFRFISETQGEETISLERLLDKEFLKSYLIELSDNFQSDKFFVTASQFVKRLGYIMTVPILYSMTIYDKKVDIGLENCHLLSKFSKGTWLPQLYLHNHSVEEPSEDDRLQWRETLLTRLFRDNISKVLDSISEVSSIPKSILWENVAVYIYWLYEKRIKEGVPNGLKRQILSDFYYLIHQAPGSMFGEANNPLQKFFGAMCETPFSTEPIRIRRTCCFYYELNPKGDCCLTCPKGKREIEQYNLNLT
jgi:ferric iron reductase protein FhuF